MSGESWTARIAGLPFTAKAKVDGDWVVTVACASVGRHVNLAEAILQATGGIAAKTEAETVATSIHARKRLHETGGRPERAASTPPLDPRKQRDDMPDALDVLPTDVVNAAGWGSASE